MIVRMLSSGKSFKGVAAYLTHDVDAETAERVGWTHTLNLAHDHVPSAVDQMLATARNAELLKQEAGIRGGGRAAENTVKHISLNWSPDDHPTREHMIETTEDFLRHMGWQDHQAVLISHIDRPHPHIHAMINVVHPETGLCLDDGFEKRRAQAWALEYERENGRIHCEQRLANIGEREEGPTRPAWLAFRGQQQVFENEENARRDQQPILLNDPENQRNLPAEEWKILKDAQRQQRLAFFAEGKSAFSELRTSIYREVREDFRDRWSDFYAAQRDGGDPAALAEIKAALVAEQKAALETRRDKACGELREARNGIYRELLDEQREARLGLAWRQEAGFDNALFLEEAGRRKAGLDITDGFGAAASTMTTPQSPDHGSPAIEGWSRRESAGMRSGSDIGASIGLGVGFGILAFIGSMGDGGSVPDRTPRRPEPEPRNPNAYEGAVEDAHNKMLREQAEADDDARRRQRSLGRE